MGKAIFVCDQYECCNIIYGKAFCPRCNQQLEFVDKEKAYCLKCKKDWSSFELNIECPRCHSVCCFKDEDNI